MKHLLLALTLVSFRAQAECLKDPSADYAKEFEAAPGDVLLTFPQKLSGKDLPFYLLAAKSSCGARSCEYAGYTKDDKNCFHRVISFTGSFEFTAPKPPGLKNLIVHEPHETGGRWSCEWQYRPEIQRFTKLPASCRIQK